MKSFAGSALSVLMALIVFIAALGSRGMTIIAGAEELNNEQEEIQADDADDKEEYLDVCFFIRGRGIGADIPAEPGNYPTDLYSSAIRVNGALSSLKYSPSTGAIDGSDESLLTDGFTASNGVSQMLDKLPQVSDIRGEVEDFDPSRHYVVWYVIKSASTSYPNADVGIHVDGVIRERTQETADDPEEPGEADSPDNPENPGEIDKPEDADAPGQTEKPTGTETPRQSDKPADTDKPGQIDKTADAEKSGQTEKAVDTDKPGQADKKTDTEKAGQTADSGKSTLPGQPKDTGTTADTGKTSGSDQTDISKVPVQLEELVQNPVQDTAQDTAEVPAEDPIPDVTIEIRALFLEDGKECREIEFDGREHIVGGFEIVIHDKETGNPIIGYLYECYGRFIGTKAYADVGLGTEFSFRGQDFWINVVKAFARVTNPGDSQEVVFYDAEDHPLRTAADFIIRDSAGNILPAKFNVLPNTGTVSIKAKDITIEAGTTVKNDDGQTLTDDSFEITSGSLMEGHRIERVVINGSQTGAGKSVNEITGINIVDENGNSVNHLYNISTVNGQLVLVETDRGEADASGESDRTSALTTSSIISVVKTDSGLTATTGNVVIESLEAAATYSSTPQVLGARRSETSDAGIPENARLFILLSCFACAVFVLKNGKHIN